MRKRVRRRRHALAGVDGLSGRSGERLVAAAPVVGGKEAGAQDAHDHYGWGKSVDVASSPQGGAQPRRRLQHKPQDRLIALSELLGLAGLAPQPKSCQTFASADNSNIYSPQVYLMRAMVKRGWHIAPNPTEVDFLKVVERRPSDGDRGRRVRSDVHRTKYSPVA